MSENEKSTGKIELFYSEHVDTMFQAYSKELLSCISRMHNAIMIAGSFDSKQLGEVFALINFLYQQYCFASKFSQEYSKIKESV